MNEEIKTLWVFQTEPSCPLKPHDLLVYSYLGNKSYYEQPVNQKQIAYNTGISINTVKPCLERLGELGLVREGQFQKRMDWFKTSENEDWYRSIWTWHYLVPRDSGPLSANDSIIYSWLRHKKLQNWAGPSGGFTVPYLAAVFNLDERTIKKSLATLEECQLVKVRGNSWKIQTNLSALQADWWKRKGERPANTSTGEGATLDDWDDEPGLPPAPPKGATLDDWEDDKNEPKLPPIINKPSGQVHVLHAEAWLCKKYDWDAFQDGRKITPLLKKAFNNGTLEISQQDFQQWKKEIEGELCQNNKSERSDNTPS